jgi:hypothetical protein
MDLNQYLSVFWRHRLIVACGIALALARALGTRVKVDHTNGLKRSDPGNHRRASTATASVDPRNPGIVLPLVQIQGNGPTAQDARHATTWATNALLTYIRKQQTTNKIAPDKRVILRILDNPSTPTLLAGRSKTRPTFVFLAVLTACAALVFILDNRKRQPRPVTEVQPTVEQPPQTAVGRWSRRSG